MHTSDWIPHHRILAMHPHIHAPRATSHEPRAIAMPRYSRRPSQKPAPKTRAPIYATIYTTITRAHIRATRFAMQTDYTRASIPDILAPHLRLHKPAPILPMPPPYTMHTLSHLRFHTRRHPFRHPGRYDILAYILADICSRLHAGIYAYILSDTLA